MEFLPKENVMTTCGALKFNSLKAISQWKTAYVSQTVTADIDMSAFVGTS